MFQGAGRWFDRHSTQVGWLVVGVVVGGAIGWWAGSFTSCARGSGCEVRVDSIEAAGTWVGGIGTVAAVLAAVAAFRHDREAREAEARLASLTSQAREQRLASEANRLAIDWVVNHTMGGGMRGAVMSVRNDADETPIHRLWVTDSFGSAVRAHTLKPNESKSTNIDLTKLSVEVPPLTDRASFQQQQLQQIVAYFKMNGRFWRRVGLEDAELIEDEEMPD